MSETKYLKEGNLMSKRKIKESENLSCRLDKAIMDQLNELSNKSGLTKTKAVERAIAMYYAQFIQTGKV
ncbi:ribbon-helix-helix protein copG family (plasmid) [Butyrivibrio proteoclasticus B316]|uniref:Ribbon-helix-helix protein copG family n=2 Tax=Butyrivibrio proteoclasticus TaxID=43305 RepID=E0S4F4_BUTPB|nr:ribbon-helix-helix protein copG family [Butyrivibrio proteoclasticus B316]